MARQFGDIMQPGFTIPQVINRQRVGEYASSLKLIYEAQSFMISIKESEEYLSADIEISVHMITFVTLWKLKKFSDAGEYLESAAKILNKVIQGFVETKMSKNSSQNLYCLIVMSLAGLKIVLEKDVNAAKSMTEDCRLQLESNSICYKLLSDFLYKIDKNLYENDWLITEVYQKILFVATFMPLIAPNTPLIKLSELEEEKDKINSVNEDSSSLGLYKGVSKDKIDSSRDSRRGVRSTPRYKNSIKPWWESNKILDFHSNSSKSHERTDKKFRSETRERRKISLNRDIKVKHSPVLMPQKFNHPYSRESLRREVIKDTDDYENEHYNDKELIMFEFNPATEQVGGEFQVQLVPLTIFKNRNSNVKDRPLTNLNISRL